MPERRVVGEDRGAAELTASRWGPSWAAERSPSCTAHAARGQAYALKWPPHGDTWLLADCQREAALLACIDDPGVARIPAAGRLDGVPALVMEHLTGGSLADLLARRPLAPGRMVELAAQLGRGLAAAHRAGLVDRDVKPANVMMCGSAKLIDFGLALLGHGPAGRPGSRDLAAAVGVEVIRAVAARVRAAIRHSDVLGRYGGEEFAVVQPDHDGTAPDLAERMRRARSPTNRCPPGGPARSR